MPGKKTRFGIRGDLSEIEGWITLMFLQGLFGKMRTRRRRAAERRNSQRGAEITKRLRELLDHSRVVPPEGDPPRKPTHNDKTHTSDKSTRTA